MSDDIKEPELIDHERPRLDDSFHLENEHPMDHVMGPDGLPKAAPNTSFRDTQSPQLSTAKFICMKAEGRPQCKFYRRQLLPSADNLTRSAIVRLCTADRGSDNQFKSVNDAEVHACELREPPDPESQQKLDDFDEALIKRQKSMEEDESFDPIAELEKENIFK